MPGRDRLGYPAGGTGRLDRKPVRRRLILGDLDSGSWRCGLASAICMNASGGSAGSNALGRARQVDRQEPADHGIHLVGNL